MQGAQPFLESPHHICWASGKCLLWRSAKTDMVSVVGSPTSKTTQPFLSGWKSSTKTSQINAWQGRMTALRAYHISNGCSVAPLHWWGYWWGFVVKVISTSFCAFLCWNWYLHYVHHRMIATLMFLYFDLLLGILWQSLVRIQYPPVQYLDFQYCVTEASYMVLQKQYAWYDSIIHVEYWNIFGFLLAELSVPSDNLGSCSVAPRYMWRSSQ